MTIAEPLLRSYHASLAAAEKGEMLFSHGDPAEFFFIVRSGRVKMVNYSEDGREFVQGYFTDGQSFGEPPFFSGAPYPASAIAVDRSEIWKIARRDFLRLLQDHFEVHLAITRNLGDRLVYKSTMLSELAIEEAEHRLLTLIRYLAERDQEQERTPVRLSFTRQQLADMTGLRVETVIRSVKSLEHKHLLRIDDDGKILFDPSHHE